MRAVWADTFVTDDVLTRCISELRRAFGEDAKEPRVIETIPRSGYRLLAAVQVVGAASSARQRGRPSQSSLRFLAGIIGLAVLVFLLVKSGIRERFFPSAPHTPIQSL